MKKQIISISLAALTVCSSLVATSCGGGNQSDNSTTTKIFAVNFDGGIGSEWLYDDIKEFEKLVENKSYESGKKGVDIDVDRAMNIGAATMNTSGYHLFFDEVQTNVRKFADNQFIVDLTDIVTTPLTEYGEEKSIVDKIDPVYLNNLVGSDGKYYGLPYYEWYPGLVYDIELFENNGLFIAKDGTSVATDTVDKYGKNIKFLKDGKNKAERSVGNDGISGTEDDGLPTSVVELLSLCYRMTKKDIKPIQTTGMHTGYTSYLVEALWASLAGYDAMRANYTFSGEIEVVKRDSNGEIIFTNDPLFTGLAGTGNDGNGTAISGNYVMKPATEKITLTEETGYKVYDMVQRYYAIAFLEIVEREGWFTKDSTTESISHTGAQKEFILNGIETGNQKRSKMGMMIEGTYWYQESVRTGAFEDYSYYSGKDEKRLGWMSLPTSLYDSVTENNGRDLAFVETSHSYVTMNAASTKNNEGVTEACKDFIRFMYTDKRLSAFTGTTGIPKGGMYYELEDSDYDRMSSFQQSVWNMRDNCKVVLSGADNDTYKAKQQSLLLNANLALFRPFVDVRYGDYAICMRWDSKNKVNAAVMFDSTCVSANAW